MKSTLALFLVVSLTTLAFAPAPRQEEHPTLPIGSKAPDFSLKSVDGKTYTLASFSNAKVLVIVFTCNHCPTAQAYEQRIIQLANDYKSRSVAVVAISPNDPSAIRLDELGYTDLSDHFEEMKIRARERNFPFPYLYDGDHQLAANAYGPIATPHVFIFDSERKLRYQGRIDDMENPKKTPQHHDTRDALEEVLAGKQVTTPTTKVFGCSIKWTEKEDLVAKGFENWAKEPVSLSQIDEPGVRELLQNKSGKLRLINVWATWCGPCVIEMPEFVTINRMYRGRDFEVVTICVDNLAKENKALEILKKNQASFTNYIFDIDNKYALIEAVDPDWQGALPYTLLVEPGGKIVYAKQDIIDPAKMKTTIVDNPMIGRVY